MPNKFRNLLFSRPLACLSLGLIAGLALSNSPVGRWALAVSLALLALALWRLAASSGSFLASLLMLGAGLFLGAWRAQGFLELSQGPLLERMPAVRVTGVVREDLGTNLEDGRTSLVLEKASVEDLLSTPAASAGWKGLVKLTFEGSLALARPGPGDRLACVGSLRPCAGPTNPGEFNYRSFLLGRGITALVSARFGTAPRLVEAGAWWGPARLAWQMRRVFVRGLYACLKPADAGLVAGVVFGDKKGIPQREIESYAKCGLSYLLAVAGLHLGLALALFLALVRLFTASRRRQAALALGMILAYAMVTGLQVPVVRAGCLFLLVLVARIADLETDFLTSLGLGALLVLLWQPGALWEAGFQFSFAVTLSVVYLSRPLALALGRGRTVPPAMLSRAGLRYRFLEFAGVILAVQLATIPLEAWHFNQFTYPVFFSNLLAVPLLPWLIGLGLVCAPLAAVWPPLAWPLAKVLALLVTILRTGSGFFSSLPLAALSVGKPPALWMLAWLVFAAAAAAYLFYFASRIPSPDAYGLMEKMDRPGKTAPLLLGLAGFGLLGWLFWPALPLAHRHPGQTYAWFLDVGQGDSILIEFEDGKTLLVDGGPGRPDAGSWVVQPALRSLGISSLDWVLMTHPDADHIGGLEWILEQVPVGLVLDRGAGEIQTDPEAEQWEGSLLKSVQAQMRIKRMPCVLVAADRPLPRDLRDRMRILWPVWGWKEATRKARNNSSLVVDVGGWLLLTGDLEKGGEKALLKSGLLRHPYQVLKLGHHGSRGASNETFLRAVKPAAVVIQAGRANRFGFPHREVLQDLSHLRPRPALFRTDLQGCLALEKEPDGVMVFPFMPAGPERLWQSPPKPPRSIWKPLEKAGLVEVMDRK